MKTWIRILLASIVGYGTSIGFVLLIPDFSNNWVNIIFAFLSGIFWMSLSISILKPFKNIWKR